MSTRRQAMVRGRLIEWNIDYTGTLIVLDLFNYHFSSRCIPAATLVWMRIVELFMSVPGAGVLELCPTRAKDNWTNEDKPIIIRMLNVYECYHNCLSVFLAICYSVCFLLLVILLFCIFVSLSLGFAYFCLFVFLFLCWSKLGLFAFLSFRLSFWNFVFF